VGSKGDGLVNVFRAKKERNRGEMSGTNDSEVRGINAEEEVGE
jgi:hypothetical protein